MISDLENGKTILLKNHMSLNTVLENENAAKISKYFNNNDSEISFPFLNPPQKRNREIIDNKATDNVYNYAAPLIQQCFDIEQQLHYIVKHIWDNENLNKNLSDFKNLKLLLYNYLLPDDPENHTAYKPDILDIKKLKTSVRISCSLYTKEINHLFCECENNIGYLYSPNGGFICASHVDANSFEVPSPARPYLNNKAYNSMSVVHKVNNKKVYVTSPRFCEFGFAQCTKLTTPSKLIDIRHPALHNEVVLDYSKAKKEAVFILSENKNSMKKSYKYEIAKEMSIKENLPMVTLFKEQMNL